jgi:hypothetical protein
MKRSNNTGSDSKRNSSKRIKLDPLNEIKKLMNNGKNDDAIKLIEQKTGQLDTFEEKELVFSTIEAAYTAPH